VPGQRDQPEPAVLLGGVLPVGVSVDDDVLAGVLEPSSQPQTVSVAAVVMSAVSTSVAAGWPSAASPASSVPVDSATQTAAEPGSPGPVGRMRPDRTW
jgi:hypothetical protein